MEINTNNLMVGSQVMKSTFTSSNTKGAVYAEKGQPMYQKDMDKDEDGVITLQEFNDYCDENDISYAQRKQMLENRLQYQLNTEHAEASAKIREIKSESEAVYAEKDDEQYDEAMDENSDGKITYEEYMKYCEEHADDEKPQETSKAVIENDDDEVVIKDSAKAVSSYAKHENGEKDSKIEKEV